MPTSVLTGRKQGIGINILLADLTSNTQGAGVLTLLASVMREEGDEPVLRNEPDLAPARRILAVAETSRLAFRYSGGGPGHEPAVVVVVSRALNHLSGMELLALDAPLAAFIVREDAGKAVPLYKPAGKLFPGQRLEAHLCLANRPLANRAELLWLLTVLHEFVLTVLGPAEFLRHLRWHRNIRLREEHFGGLLFVPETSQVIELSPERFEAVRRAVALNSPQALVEKLGADPAATIGALSTAGALTTLAPESQ